MGTIFSRKRGDGITAYTAQIRIHRGDKRHVESQTFDRRPAAAAWLKKRETELAAPGALDRVTVTDPTLGEVIDKYIATSRKEIGRTKAQVLATIKGYAIAEMKCSEITSQSISAFAGELTGRQASTVANYVSHLSAVFKAAKPLWGYPLDYQAMRDAAMAMAHHGMIARSNQRDRRPTLEELDGLMTHFGAKRKGSLPMQQVVAFAIFSTRRQEEILTLQWADLDETGGRILVRDMKHPGEKSGNDVWCELPLEALRIGQAMPRTGTRIFPFSTDAVSASFTRACQFLEIEDLHFHDLRHEGISRLFELGRTIPQAASVSGHRTWQSLKRYSHIRHAGDKYGGWAWLDAVTKPLS